MQGVHAFEPKVKSSIDLDSFVAEDHFLRRIDCVLDLRDPNQCKKSSRIRTRQTALFQQARSLFGTSFAKRAKMSY
jgi:hypothetical protein